MSSDSQPIGSKYALPPSVASRLEGKEPWKSATWEYLKLPSKECVDNAIHIKDMLDLLDAAGIDTKNGVCVGLEPESEVQKRGALNSWHLFLQRQDNEFGGTADILLPGGRLYGTHLYYNLEKNHCQLMTVQEPQKAKEGKIGHLVLTTCKGFIRVRVMRSLSGRPYLTIGGGSLECRDVIPDDARLKGCVTIDFQRLTSESPLGDAPILIYIQEAEDLSETDNSSYGPAPAGGWNKKNWKKAPSGVEFWIYYADLPLHTRDGRALAAVSYLASLYDPRAEKSDILQVLENIAEFAEISVEKAVELIKLGEEDAAEFERLMTLRKSSEKP